MSFHKWMPGGQDTAQALLNTDKLSCSWGLHTALWRLLHPLTYNNKEQVGVQNSGRGLCARARGRRHGLHSCSPAAPLHPHAAPPAARRVCRQ